MAARTTRTATKPATKPTERKPVTFEMVVAMTPTATQAGKIAAAFGLEEVDYDTIRDTTEEHLALASKDLPLSDKALEMHLQRITGSYVSSAFGAAQFYSQKASQARDLTSKLANDDRDEDRDGVSGFDSKAERARSFAGEMGLQAYALMAAAEAAVSVYAHLTGSEWKPYESATSSARTVSQGSAAAQLAALG